jgi:4-hydroxyphenylpyruvate dioxygenase
MIVCVSQATTLAGSFADDLVDYPAAGCRHIEVWLTKLEKHLGDISVASTQAAIREKGIELVAASYQGGLLLSQGEQRAAHFEHFRRRLDICHTFGIKTLNLVADFASTVDNQSLARAIVSLTQAGQWAAAFGVRLALEFRGGDTFCSCLDTAISLVEQCREPNVGVCLDLFHYYKGPSKAEDFSRLTKTNLFHVQLCDVAGLPREMMSDSDRIMPGEGDFQYGLLLDTLQRIDYDGTVSLELFNPVLWQSNQKQIVELGLTAMERVLKS